MKKLLLILLISLFWSCNFQDKRPLVGKTEYQRKLNSQFKDASTSPLKKKDLRNFKELEFFPVDSNYVVTASLVKTPDAPAVKFERTGGDEADYLEYGILEFSLQETDYQLKLYRSIEEMFDPRYKDYLFLPFTDETCGKDSYDGGRYMNLYISKIQDNNTIVLNFNNTYNPYCAYNEKYTCPIVPRENHLPLEVKAGIKDFKKLAKK